MTFKFVQKMLAMFTPGDLFTKRIFTVKKLALLLALLLPGVASSTTYVCFSVTATSGGSPMVSPSVLVQTVYPSIATATIKTDSTGATPKANPFTGGSDGVVTFCAVPGTYKVTASLSGYQSYVTQITKYAPQESGGGGITAPGTTTDYSIPTWNGTAGAALRNSAWQVDASDFLLYPSVFVFDTTYQTFTMGLGTRLCWGNQANKDVAVLCIGHNSDDSLGVSGAFNDTLGTNGLGTQVFTDTPPATCAAGNGRSALDVGTVKRICYCVATNSWYCVALTPA